MKRIIYLALLLCAIIFSKSSLAVSCGDVISSSVTLTANLNCSSGYYALQVAPGSSHLTINLNGYSIIGNTAMQGIIIDDAAKVTIAGNGSIGYFNIAVNVNNSKLVNIKDVEFYKNGTAVVLNRSSQSSIRNNRFIKQYGHTVQMLVPAIGVTRPTTENEIVNNEFESNHLGVELCGSETYDNHIVDNIFKNNAEAVVKLIDMTHSNIISGNWVENTKESAFLLHATRDNRIVSNSVYDGMRHGIEFVPQLAGICQLPPSSSPDTSYNLVQGNHFIGNALHGVALTDLGTSARNLKNRIDTNKIYDNGDRGVYLMGPNSIKNTVSNNAIFGNPVPLDDNGVNTQLLGNFCSPISC